MSKETDLRYVSPNIKLEEAQKTICDQILLAAHQTKGYVESILDRYLAEPVPLTEGQLDFLKSAR